MRISRHSAAISTGFAEKSQGQYVDFEEGNLRRNRAALTALESGDEMTEKHNPTDKRRAEVSALVSYGVSQDEIAVYMGIAPKTLRKHYRHELETGAIKANAQIAKALFNQAKRGNVQAQKFWLSARADWREKKDIDARVEGSVTAIAIVSEGADYKPDEPEDD